MIQAKSACEKGLRVGIFGLLLMWQPITAMETAKGEPAAGEYARHFAALGRLSMEVAQAMPAEKYGFKPHPDSMNFGALMFHIAATNYQFCAGLADIQPPDLATWGSGIASQAEASVAVKSAVMKSLADSFAYCAPIIEKMNEKQLEATHNSPDGKLPGWDVLLAMFVHVAHHRGQAEIYLRDNGIAPPPYRI